VSFPVYPLNPVKGSLVYCGGCTADGMPVTLCGDGVNVWESTLVESQKNAVCISGAIKKLLAPYTQSEFSNVKLFCDIPSGRLFVAVGNVTYIYDIRLKCWYRLDGITSSRFVSCFGGVYIASNDKKLYRLTAENNDHTAVYTTHFSDFGSHRLMNVRDIVLTLKAGENTAGSVTAEWNDQGKKRTRTESFSVSSAFNGSVVRLRIPLYIPYADGAAFTFVCPPGKDMTLLGYEVTTNDKGELPYGI
jgi:hypothetical protein